MEFEQFQQKQWLTRLRRDFDYRFAYGFDDQDDVFASLIEDVIVSKLPEVDLTDKADPAGYVLAMFRKRAIDYFRHFHKRHRPPADLCRMEEPYPQIFYEFCLGGFSNNEIAERLRLALHEVATWVRWLREEQKCPKTLKTVSLHEMSITGDIPDNPQYDSIQHLSSVEQAFTSTSNAVLANWILGNLPTDPTVEGQSDTTEANATNWLKLLETLPPVPISADDVLLLKMLYFEGLSLEIAGSVLGMADHQVAYRRDKILEQLEAFFRWHKVEFDV